jgi:ribosomal-protein-alanine N-acetyltransferase
VTDEAGIRLIVPGPAYLGVLAGIHAACFEEAWDEAALAPMIGLPGSIALLALDGDEPAGLIFARVTAGEGEVITLGVVPAMRRHGVAHLLLERMLRGARDLGCAPMFLEVAAGNEPAISLYRSIGFREIGRRRAYYRLSDGSREDALVMRKDL